MMMMVRMMIIVALTKVMMMVAKDDNDNEESGCICFFDLLCQFGINPQLTGQLTHTSASIIWKQCGLVSTQQTKASDGG